MKHVFIISLIGLLVAGTNSFAQGHHSPHEGKKNHKMEQMSPQDRAEIQTKKMTLALDLNEAQQKDVSAVLLDFHSEMQAMKEASKKDSKELTEEEKQERRLNHLDAQIALKEEMKGILNKEQYQKFSDQMQSSKRKMKRHKSRKRK